MPFAGGPLDSPASSSWITSALSMSDSGSPSLLFRSWWWCDVARPLRVAMPSSCELPASPPAIAAASRCAASSSIAAASSPAGATSSSSTPSSSSIGSSTTRLDSAPSSSLSGQWYLSQRGSSVSVASPSPSPSPDTAEPSSGTAAAAPCSQPHPPTPSVPPAPSAPASGAVCPARLRRCERFLSSSSTAFLGEQMTTSDQWRCSLIGTKMTSLSKRSTPRAQRLTDW
mmetsp:Transcript_19370/g.57753  ORF Transcript_19370/g.57753 Transcript_19370/m.57753 type:complete len:228 (+) Transcript_19370:319-1002(+)